MSNRTAGYSFIIEFSQRFANRLVRTLFELVDAGVPSRFTHDEQGQPGLISSRNSLSGRQSYRNWPRHHVGVGAGRGQGRIDRH